MGLGIGKEPVWCPLAVERSVRESKIFTERKRKKKNEQNTTLDNGRPWGRTKGEKKRRCRRKAGRLGAGELGLERSSVTVPSKKAEGPLVVWVRSVRVGAR